MKNVYSKNKIHCGNLADKTWANNFFFNFLDTKNEDPATTRAPDLGVQRHMIYLKATGEATLQLFREKKRNEKKSANDQNIMLN